MKRVKYSIVVPITLLICIISLIKYKPGLVADVLYKSKMYNTASRLYEANYNNVNKIEVLDRLCTSLIHTQKYDKQIYYLDKLLSEQQYISAKDDITVDELRYSYLVSLYKAGEKDKFKEYFQNDSYKFSNEMHWKLKVIDIILLDSKATKEDCNFAIEQDKILFTQKESIDKDLIPGLYSQVIKLYQKIGDTESAQKYIEEAKQYIEKNKVIMKND